MMVNKLSRLIDSLPYNDLLKVHKDLQAGNIDSLIEQKLRVLSPTKSGACPICQGEVSESDHLTLIFGPASFKQKASFDGVDCLQYFLERIKQRDSVKERVIVKK